jgi:hypothetical protein
MAYGQPAHGGPDKRKFFIKHYRLLTVIIGVPAAGQMYPQ